MEPSDETRRARLRRLEALRSELCALEEELNPARGTLPESLPSRAGQHVVTRADVSARVLAPFLESAGAGGRPPDFLLAGLSLDLSDGLDAQDWLSWEEFCVFCGHLDRAFDDTQIARMGQILGRDEVFDEVDLLASLMAHPAELYEWLAHRVFGAAGAWFRCVRFVVERADEGPVHLRVALPEGYRHNPVFFRLLEGWLVETPILVGAGRAAVTMRPAEGGAEYTVDLPEAAWAQRPEPRGAGDPARLRGALAYVLGRNRELDRHTAAREADFDLVQASEKRFRVLTELTNDYCFLAQLTDEALECEWITGSHARITGYGSGDLLRMGVHGIVLADDRDNVAQALAALRRGEPVQHEYRILTRQEEVRWVREHLRPEIFVDGSIGAVYGAVRDVTAWHLSQREQEDLEEQLRQSQKMDAVGRLAGGIAHDFNNLLTVILTHVGFLLRALREDTQEHDDAVDIQQAARRAAGLTQRLLTFSRQQVVTPTVLDLNHVIRDLEPVLSSLVGEGIELDIQLDPRQSCIRMDRAQLEQILLNLVVNARDAMLQGGRVTLATGEVDLGEAFVKLHPGATSGRHVALAVRDTGCGMDEQTLPRIFEPFFSTKAPDKGTGLGLSTVYGIVRQARGNIDVESQPGFGTTFEIYFPVAEGVVVPTPSARPRALDSQHQETILVVEDEEGVRRGVQRILKHAGYQVLLAADPAQAIALVEDYEGQLDLLLTDVVMPMMNGVQLAERVKGMRQDIRVLYMSGYTSDGVDTGAVMDEEIGFLHKPFTRQAMLAKVAEVLSGVPRDDSSVASG